MLCARREQWLTPALDELRAKGFRAEGRVCDVTDEQQVQAVVQAAVSAYGRVDILVNNAGISWGERPETMSLDNFRKVLDTNLTGAFLFAQAAGRVMLEAKRGAIINMSSRSGLVGIPGAAAYASSKAAIIGPSSAAATHLRKLFAAGSPARGNA